MNIFREGALLLVWGWMFVFLGVVIGGITIVAAIRALEFMLTLLGLSP